MQVRGQHQPIFPFLLSILPVLKDWLLIPQETKSLQKAPCPHFTNCLGEFSSEDTRASSLLCSIWTCSIKTVKLTRPQTPLEGWATPVLTTLAFSTTSKNISLSAQWCSLLLYFHFHFHFVLLPPLGSWHPLRLPSKSFPWCSLWRHVEQYKSRILHSSRSRFSDPKVHLLCDPNWCIWSLMPIPSFVKSR